MPYIVGVDIGTQGIKAVALDENLRPAARVYAETSVSSPRPGWVEHDAEAVWWRGFCHAVEKLLAELPNRDILGVGCSGIAPCMLPVGADGKPLRPAILYGIDTRCRDEVLEMTEILGEETVLKLNKRPLTTQSVGPKILWFRKHEPELFRQTTRVFSATNYVINRLTNAFVIDRPQACEMAPFYSYDIGNWDDRVLDTFDIPRSMLPEIRRSYEAAGVITSAAAKECGLPEGIPVTTATVDAFAEFISTGAYSQGEAAVIYGTTGVIALTTDKLPVMKDIWIFPHPLFDDHYLAIGAMAATAALTKWFRDNFGDLEKLMEQRVNRSAYEFLSDQAAAVPAGSEGLLALPYFNGERTPIADPLASGVIMGLTTYHTRAHVYRALLESAAYGFRHHLDLFENYGFSVQQVTACGGGAKSSLWVQIVSDVTGFDQIRPCVSLGSDVGTAYLVARTVGWIDSFSSLKERLSGDALATITADPAARATYDGYYKVYRSLYGSIKDEMHALAALQR